jgi:ABC-2 type transport system permease protein
MNLTITMLTIRQFLRSKSIFVVLGIGLLPSLLAIIARIQPEELSNRELREIFGNALYRGMYVGTLLPLGTLILATSAIGDEIEDRTLQYLYLKPISRLRIVLEKALAVFIVLVPLLWVGIVVMWSIIAFGNVDALRNLLVPALLSSLVAIIGFGTLFMLLSTVIQRALLVGIFYVFVWETSLSRWLPGIRTISIRHFTESLFVRLASDRSIRLSQVSSETTVYITIAAVGAITLALATWRLRAMSLE